MALLLYELAELPLDAGNGERSLRLACRLEKLLRLPVWNISVPKSFDAEGSANLSDRASMPEQQRESLTSVRNRVCLRIL